MSGSLASVSMARALRIQFRVIGALGIFWVAAWLRTIRGSDLELKPRMKALLMRLDGIATQLVHRQERRDPTLAEQSSDVAPFTYRQVEPGLFGAVVMQQLPPGPGPTAGRGGPGVHPRAER